MGNNSCAVCFSVIFGIVTIVGVSLFGSSFGTIELNQAALYRNKYSVQIDESKVYLSGRYFTGLGGEFIIYPTTWQYINFSTDQGSDSSVISTKSADGTSITLEVSIIFRLKYEFLAQIYQVYKTNYRSIMISTAQNQISQVVVNYTANDLFQNRKLIQNQMSQSLSALYRSQFNCDLILLLLRQIGLQQRFEDTIVQTQIKQQEVKTADQNNLIQTIQAQISVINSNANLQINQNYADANSISSALVATKSAAGDALILQAEGLALKSYRAPPLTADQIAQMKTQNIQNGVVDEGDESSYLYQLGFTEAQIIRFVFIEKLISMNNINLMLDVPDTAIYKV